MLAVSAAYVFIFMYKEQKFVQNDIKNNKNE